MALIKETKQIGEHLYCAVFKTSNGGQYRQMLGVFLTKHGAFFEELPYLRRLGWIKHHEEEEFLVLIWRSDIVDYDPQLELQEWANTLSVNSDWERYDLDGNFLHGEKGFKG